jgi:predicted dehydrogenase
MPRTRPSVSGAGHGARTASERAATQRKMRKVRFAVVGLGYISQAAVLPAFAHARRDCELAALVSGDGTKLARLARRYGVRHTATYDAYDRLLASGEVDAVYIALPNSLHADFTIRAARAGVHVLCEKPMAVTVREGEAMIRAAARYDVRLMIAYRLHFERGNLEAVRIVQSGQLGEPRQFHSLFAMQVKDGNTRLRAALGGGPLADIGIYCINAARSLFRSEPVQATACHVAGDDPRFREVEEAVGAVLRFPGDRLATFSCSFGSAGASRYTVLGTKGSLRLDPAYAHAEGITHHLERGEKTRTRTFPKRDQFAPELIYFARCVRERRDPQPSGREGLADLRVIEAIRRSARTGRAGRIPPYEPGPRPDLAREIHRPALRRVELVHADTPSKD